MIPNFPVVGIGASAGGLEAFRSFFEHMPNDCGMAFVVILHLPLDHKSMLPEILAHWTKMRVVQVSEGTPVEPNCIYVPPPHAVVTLQGGRMGVGAMGDPERLPRPIDRFFDTLAASLGDRAVGIVLSGTGSDGALGLKAIKERGGLTLAQGTDGSSPQYNEMPAGAIATGSVDVVVPVEAMPGQLLKLSGKRFEPLGVSSTGPDDSARLRICDIVRRQLGHDFSGYRDKTFLRRVQRRMQVVGANTLEEYIDVLHTNRGEVVMLFHDLLIRVTSFFRDKETFERLEERVIPRLFANKQADGLVRLWVPGCATGEEAYSLAMLVREHMDTLINAPRVQLFATDIDDAAVSTARLGRYPPTLLDGLSDRRRSRFFTLAHGTYQVAKEIRDLCTFSAHNLVRDPPFSRMDLVSCRNLLIYLDKELQSMVLPLFHYALVPGGLLLLGSSESASHFADLFEPFDKAARIFVRRSGRSPALPMSAGRDGLPPLGPQLDTSISRLAAGENAPAATATPVDVAYRRIEPTRKESMETHTSGGDGVAVPAPGAITRVVLSLLPGTRHVPHLEQDLRSAREQLQSLSEEHQTALEELRSANEELHSVNEEMQSTNEELETSKEELQSLNEELHTVNLRLTEKVDELDRSNSDLRNLFESTEIATVFLDRHMIVRSFTPAIAQLYNLIPSDKGRPLTDIVTRLNYAQLRADVARVLSTLEPLERRVARDDGAMHFIMRILPYREPDSTVTGVLVTFVDVTSIVQAEAALVDADTRKDVFLATLSHELRNPLAPIRTAAMLLRHSNLDAAQLAQAQAIIVRQVGHLSSLLDDLLDVSRITRGAFQLKKQYVSLASLIMSATEAVQPAIAAHGHQLRVDCPVGSTVLEADPVRLTQVLSNLLTNSIKYTDRGGLITLSCRVHADAVRLSVSDNGVGLAPEMLNKVFDMFTRVTDNPLRSEGGLGIGLALAKGLVELHGGHIEARSDGRGHGSEFSVVLPRSLVVDITETGASAKGNGNGTPRRILIADDNLDAAETLGLYLQYRGHEIHIARSGTEALAVAAAVRPEVAVIDIGMPDISGYDVVERLRHEAWGEHIKLIALTGWGQDTDRRRALAAGFNHHCTKPIDPTELERLLETDAAAP